MLPVVVKTSVTPSISARWGPTSASALRSQVISMNAVSIGNRSCEVKLIADQLLEPGLAQRPRDLELDDATPVDEDRARRSVDLVSVSETGGLVEEAAVGHLELVAEDLRRLQVVANRDPEDQQPLRGVVGERAGDPLLLGAAWPAPRGPEIQHQRVAAIVGQLDRLAIEVGPGEVGRRLADSGLALVGLLQWLLERAAGQPDQGGHQDQAGPGAPTWRRSGGRRSRG